MGPRTRTATTGVPLTVLAKDLKPEQIEERLTRAFDRVLTRVRKDLSAEARAYNKQMRAARKDLRKLADLVDNSPSFLVPEWDTGNMRVKTTPEFEGDEELIDSYVEKLQVAGTLSEIADIVDRANAKGIKFIIRASATVSVDASTLENMRDDFVSKTAAVLNDNLFPFEGTDEKPDPNGLASFNIGNERLATLFHNAMKDEISITQPKLPPSEPIPFDEATIARNKFPLTMEHDGSTITVSWANWLAPNAQKIEHASLDTIPKKTTRPV